MRPSVELSQFYGVRATAWQQAGLTLSESSYPANLKMPSHAHEPAYFGIVLNGGYSERVATNTRECKPLTTVYHPRGESHSVFFHNSPVRIFRIEITGEWRERVGPYLAFPEERAESDGGPLASLALRLHNEFRSRDPWSRLAIEGLALEMMAELRYDAIRLSRGLPSGLISSKIAFEFQDIARRLFYSSLACVCG
ncbi:MAG: hypothetical protein WAV20_12450 [Blastocatellia bacterium]